MPTSVALDSNLLEATLRLRVDISGAAYALYWKETNGKFTVAGSTMSPAAELALLKRGVDETSYVTRSSELELEDHADVFSFPGRFLPFQGQFKTSCSSIITIGIGRHIEFVNPKPKFARWMKTKVTRTCTGLGLHCGVSGELSLSSVHFINQNLIDP